jgi:hypothetical protein
VEGQFSDGVKKQVCFGRQFSDGAKNMFFLAKADILSGKNMFSDNLNFLTVQKTCFPTISIF